MEMQMEVVEEMLAEHPLDPAARLIQAAARLEAVAERLSGLEVELQASASLEQRLKEAEATIAALRAGGRKTLGTGVGMLQAKEGTAAEGGSLAGALDRALVSLSLEQRIAVKSQLQRSGLLG
jgi:hypothetical protein